MVALCFCALIMLLTSAPQHLATTMEARSDTPMRQTFKALFPASPSRAAYTSESAGREGGMPGQPSQHPSKALFLPVPIELHTRRSLLGGRAGCLANRPSILPRPCSLPVSTELHICQSVPGAMAGCLANPPSTLRHSRRCLHRQQPRKHRRCKTSLGMPRQAVP